MSFLNKMFKASRKPSSARERDAEIERFSSTGRELLEELGYSIYPLRGKALVTLQAETGEPILEEYQLREFLDGQWIKFQSPGDFWYEVSLPTEVAIKVDNPILPDSADKGYKYHQYMVARFSDAISKQVPDVSAIIGTASYYVELAMLHRRITRRPLFGDNVRLVTSSEYKGNGYKGNGEYLVQVGRSKKGLHCWEYWLGTGGRYDVWLMPLVVPQGIR
jgi:hypothetical protein